MKNIIVKNREYVIIKDLGVSEPVTKILKNEKDFITEIKELIESELPGIVTISKDMKELLSKSVISELENFLFSKDIIFMDTIQ